MIASTQKAAELGGFDWNQEHVVLARRITDRILEQAPGAFSKLVLVSSLCERRAGEYHHPALDAAVPSSVANQVLRDSHEQVFSRWLELILEEQWKEVSEYLVTEAAEPAASGVSAGKPLEALIPPTTREPQRELFLSDLQLVLSLLEK
jgi:hypothetical protein